MKKVIMFVMLFMLAGGSVLAQWTTYTFRLFDDAGAPVSGQESNIKFTRYPHVYASDQISGITVDEDGTTGIYMATGFTTLEYARIWLSGVARSKPDSVLVGNLFTYINTVLGNYVNLTGTQTISGTKTFGNGNISGDWLQSLGTFTMYGPKINTGATIYSSYGSVNSDHMVWRGFTDSNYVPKSWMYDAGSGVLRLQSGYKLYGRTNSTAPINVNTSHFSYSSDMLSLLNPSTTDSVTIKKDTTISEATYSKLWSIKRKFFSQRDSMDLYWYYKNTYANTSDSFAVINKVSDLADVNASNNIDNSDWENIDTLIYPGPGTYSVNVTFEYEFQYVTPTNSKYDSLNVGIFNGNPSEEDPIVYSTYKLAYSNTVPNGLQGQGTFTFVSKITNSAYYYVFAAKSSKTTTIAEGSPGVFIKRYRISAIRIN